MVRYSAEGSQGFVSANFIFAWFPMILWRNGAFLPQVRKHLKYIQHSSYLEASYSEMSITFSYSLQYASNETINAVVYP